MGIAELLREQILVKDIKIKLNIAKTLFLIIVANLTKYLNDKNGIFSLFAVPVLERKWITCYILSKFYRNICCCHLRMKMDWL